MSFKTDYASGLNQEAQILPLIKTKKKYNNLKKAQYKYSSYDFFNDKFEIELKSRNVKHDTYKDTIIACDKVERETDKKIVLFFKFTDGLFYIRYRKSKFDKFIKEPFVRNKRNDFNDKKKEYYHIPISKLKEF